MDIIGGLAAATQAVTLVKELRALDQNVDKTAFKLKLAELQEALADSKVALSDAKVSLNEKDDTIRSLEGELIKLKKGDLCPRCRSGRLQLMSTEKEYHFGLNHFGVEKWKYVCDEPDCQHEMVRTHDPAGVLPKVAAEKMKR